MGLRDRLRGDDGPAPQRYQMREKLLSIGDDYWIEDEAGRRAFKVDGKAVRVRDTFVLRDAARQRGRQDPGAQAPGARHDGDRARRRQRHRPQGAGRASGTGSRSTSTADRT